MRNFIKKTEVKPEASFKENTIFNIGINTFL